MAGYDSGFQDVAWAIGAGSGGNVYVTGESGPWLEADIATVAYAELGAAITDLLEAVEALYDSATLDRAYGLLTQVEAASKSIEKGRTAPACNQLSASINQVEHLVRKKLTPEQAQTLITIATQVRASLGCG